MKKIITSIICLMLLLNVIPVEAAGSVTVSKSSISLTEGASTTFTIKASSAAGRVDISTSDASVAKINKTNAFLDNSSVGVTVTAVKKGTATISIKLSDMGTYDGAVLSGTKTVKITVTEKKKTTPTTPTKPTKPTTPTTPTTPKQEENIQVTNIKIVGYPIEFKEETKTYAIDVDKSVDEIYIETKSNGTVTGAGTVSIQGKNEITLKFAKGTKTVDYKIKIVRHEREKVGERVIEETEIEIPKTNNTYLITTIIFMVATLISGVTLLAYAIPKKPKKQMVKKEMSKAPITKVYPKPEAKEVHKVESKVVPNPVTKTVEKPSEKTETKPAPKVEHKLEPVKEKTAEVKKEEPKDNKIPVKIIVTEVKEEKKEDKKI